jgi:hypothetical protein
MTEYISSWILAAVSGLIYPTLACAYFLQYGRRKAEVRQLLEISDLTSAYVAAFHRPPKEKSTESKEQANKVLNNVLDLNGKAWVIPLAICMLVAAAGTGVCLISTGRPFGPVSLETWIGRNVSPYAIAGFAGGYVWGLYDLLERFTIFNWTPASIHWLYFRLVLGPILGGYLALLFNPNIGPFVAFAVAAFPASTVRNWLRVWVRDKLSLPDPTESDVKPMWGMIQGLTPNIVDRLKEAGVSSAAHLANDDPIRLLRVTNIEWKNILDMMDQAYLTLYVGDSVSALRPLGIRGAVEMAELYRRRQHRGDPLPAPSGEVADALKIGTEAVTNLARNLAHDPVVTFLNRLWFGPLEHGRTESVAAGVVTKG